MPIVNRLDQFLRPLPVRRALCHPESSFSIRWALAHQYPSQLSQGLQDEIFGNVASIVAFDLSAKDAQAIRKELFDLPLLQGAAGQREAVMALRGDGNSGPKGEVTHENRC